MYSFACLFYGEKCINEHGKKGEIYFCKLKAGVQGRISFEFYILGSNFNCLAFSINFLGTINLSYPPLSSAFHFLRVL